MNPFFSFDDDEFFGDLLLMGAAGGGKAVEATATGNPLTFLTDLARPLKSLLIPFTPVQSGTGDPSPQNIRPILPWNGLTVYHSGADTSEYTETDISFPSPVYGGTLDVVSGVLKPYKRIEYGGQSVWSQASDVSGKHRFYRTLSDIQYGVNVNAVSACNEFTPVQQSDYTTDNNVQCSRYDPQLFIVTSEIETREQLSQFLSEHPLTIVYEPVSPHEQTLTGHQITALVGENTIWSDADGSMTAVYLKKG